MARLLDDAFGHWLAGFLDGEACFSAHARKRTVEQVTYSLRMEVCLRDDDRAILEEIHERTGLGTMYRRDYPSLRRLGRAQSVWRVGSKSDCLGLVALLDRYPLRAKKARDFAVWREMAFEWERMTHSGAPGRGGSIRNDWTRMSILAVQLKEVRAYA